MREGNGAVANLDARSEYLRRLDARRTVAERLALTERRIGTARLVVFLAGVAMLWIVLVPHRLPEASLLLPAAVFVGLMLRHERVITSRHGAERSAVFYEAGQRRLDEQWAGNGEAGERFLDAEHPYANDLDLFGRGSLFELLCTARTRAGEETLARWLLQPASPDDSEQRQEAVGELRGRLDLREELALLGVNVRAGLHPEALARWGTTPPILASRDARRAAIALSVATVLALAASLITARSLPLALLLVIQAIFGWSLRARVQRVVRAVALPGEDLALLSGLLARIEREPVRARRLLTLRRSLDTDGVPPSRRIAQLQRLVHLLDARKNQFFAPFAPLLLWTTHCAFAIEAWRSVAGSHLPQWLATVGEFEALAALAGYAYEHPSDPFAEVISHGPLFAAEQLGHPLIPLQRCVRNDVRLDDDLRVLIVSGSNMSGKSTLLRTVGTNAVLALAGAPVRAARLRISPLALGASIRIQDSLQTGSSRFYAEITRLRQLVDIARGSPLLFLLDEILHGTNSHDRRIGAEAVVRSLVELGAIGLVTTHDLALAHIVEALAPHAANVHFEDHLEDGQMRFDYRMRDGVVQKSNALELMRAVGLKV